MKFIVARLIDLTIAFICFSLMLLAYWAIFDVSPAYNAKFISFENEGKVRAGQELVINFDVTWLRACHVEATRYIDLDDNVEKYVILNVVYRDIKVSDVGTSNSKYPVHNLIPPETQPGVYYFIVKAQISCNPLQRIWPLNEIVTKQKFEVIK